MDIKEFAKGLDEEALLYLSENDNSRSRAFANSLVERLKEQLGVENYTNAYDMVKSMDGRVLGKWVRGDCKCMRSGVVFQFQRLVNVCNRLFYEKLIRAPGLQDANQNCVNYCFVLKCSCLIGPVCMDMLCEVIC